MSDTFVLSNRRLTSEENKALYSLCEVVSDISDLFATGYCHDSWGSLAEDSRDQARILIEWAQEFELLRKDDEDYLDSLVSFFQKKMEDFLGKTLD